MTVLCWFGVLIDFVLSVICSKKAASSSSVPSCLSASISKQGAQYINGALFGILFVLMAIVSVPLCGILQRFASQNRTISTNVKRLSVIFSIFGFAFFSRSIYDFATKLNGNFWPTFLGLLLPLVWDFLPLFLMALFHLKQKDVQFGDLSSLG